MKKIYNLPAEELMYSGHAACPGCVLALAIRFVLKGLGKRTILVNPDSCSSAILGTFPHSSVNVPVYLSPFATTAAAATGLSRALKVLGESDCAVVGLAGDGGTYDIGFKALSAAAGRNEDIIYICLNNEGYMNTGNQASGATPFGAITKSTLDGKKTTNKRLPPIMAAHKIPYLATATVAFPEDLINKIKKARSMKGTRYIEILTPCVQGWGIDPGTSIKISRLAVQSRYFPLFEKEKGAPYHITVDPSLRNVSEFVKAQRRFSNITESELADIQEDINEYWNELKCS